LPTIARGDRNTTSVINWFVLLEGAPYDPFEVGFRIIDITAGLPGTQIFPATSGDYEIITIAGQFQVGAWYAFSIADGAGWECPLAANLGTHRTIWRWRDYAGGPYLYGREDFTVVSSGATGGDPLYCSVDDIRSYGLTDPPYTDDMIEVAIRLWQAFIERVCRQWFYPKDLEFWVDGTDSDALHFGVPIISIDELRLNDCPAPLETTAYKVYSSRDYPVDRQNPRIKLVDSWAEQRDIYTAPDRLGRRLFRKGRQNQYISGTFGYTEEDGSVPLLIKRALCKLVVEKLTHPIYQDPAAPGITPPALVSGIVTEEWTDGHKLKYAQSGGQLNPRAPGLAGITDDQEILGILRLFRAPIGIATPAHPSFR